jgi:hypothetical protein
MEEEKNLLEEAMEGIKDRPVIFRTADDASRYYANSAQFTVSFFDIGIIFGQIVDAGKERLLIETGVTVTMSPQHAKEVSKHLQKNIEMYEAKFGTIAELPK